MSEHSASEPEKGSTDAGEEVDSSGKEQKEEANVGDGATGTGEVKEEAGGEVRGDEGKEAVRTDGDEVKGAGDEVKGDGEEVKGDEVKGDEEKGGEVKEAMKGDGEEVKSEKDTGDEVKGDEVKGDEEKGDAEVVKGVGEDVKGVGEDVKGDGEDVKGDGEDVKGDGEDVKGDGEDVKGAGEDVKGDGDEVKGAGDEVKGAGEDVKGDGDEVKGAGDEVKGAGEDVKDDGRPVEETQASGEGLEEDAELAQASFDGVAMQPSSALENIAEEKEEEEEEVDREGLISLCRNALMEQAKARVLNTQLQHKIAEYLARKKQTDDRPDPGRNVTDQEKRYIQCMAVLDTLHQELRDTKAKCDLQERELEELRTLKVSEVQQAMKDFAAYKKETALTAVHSRTGKKLTQQEVDQYLELESRKESDVIRARLENIKLQNKIHRQETILKQKDQLAEGLHMIDFEQLKINNVDLNEKIEERNEEITKLKKKNMATVQVLTHLKEKLQFLQTENSEKRANLREVEAAVAHKRDLLNRTKQTRDMLRMDNLHLRQRGGLVVHTALLRDFEEQKDESESLKARVEFLRDRHLELTVACDGMRRKIEEAKTVQMTHSHIN